MMQLSREERMLQVESMTNIRDLGGYETQSGYYTKSHKFIRSTNPSKLTDEEKEYLYNYGIRLQIDLRSDFEIEQQPSSLIGYKDIEYIRIDLMKTKNLNVLPKEIANYKDLAGFYIYMLEANKEQFKELFEVFYDHPYDAIMFNCSAGKDRTGVIAALLLDLAGCHDYDIVKDYSESYENNLKIISELERLVDDANRAFLESAPQMMMKFLDYLREHYGSAKEYLVSCGLEEEKIIEIIENFVI